MSEIPLDINIVKSIVYSSFIVRNITIRFNEPAKVDLMLIPLVPVTEPAYETIYIPVDQYTHWQYDENVIIDYCKTYLQEKYQVSPY